MKERVAKRAKRALFLEKRQVQRNNVNQIKLNFVAGLLNRFYCNFLDQFRLQGLAWRKFGKHASNKILPPS